MSSRTPTPASPMMVDENCHSITNSDSMNAGEDDVERDHDNWNVTPPPFTIDERVFCIDRGRSNNMYPAVIKKTKLITTAASTASSTDAASTTVRQSQTSWAFLIHYLGWNSRWDRWISSDEMVPDTDENQILYRRQQQREQPTASAATATFGSSGGHGTALGGNKRKQSSSGAGNGPLDASNTASSRKKSTPQQQKCMSYYQDHCELPLTLKTVLLEEWEKVTRKGWNSPHGYDEVLRTTSTIQQNQPSYPARVVHDLPAKVTIRQALNHFYKTRSEKIMQKQQTKQQPSAADDNDTNNTHAQQPSSNSSTATIERLKEFCQGLVQLFQEALPVCLLYPQERPQYEYLMAKMQRQQEKQQQHQKNENGGGSCSNAPNKKKSLLLVDVYGCEFLLRLLVRLPILMQQQTPSITLQNQAWVGPMISDFIHLLQKNRQAIFFKGNFRTPKRPDEWLQWEKEVYGASSDS